MSASAAKVGARSTAEPCPERSHPPVSRASALDEERKSLGVAGVESRRAVGSKIRGEMNVVEFLIGRVVEEVRYGSGLRIVFDLGDRVEPALYADLGRFVFTDPDGVEHQVDEDDPVSVGPALSMVGQTVASAATDDRAALELRVSNGSGLRCEPDERFEAWQVVGGSPASLIVCVGPGDLGVWDRGTRPVEL
jgi:hypothetical protein